MIKQPAHSALSPGQDDVEELHTGLLQHRRHQYCHSMLDEWADRQNQEGRGQHMCFFLCFFLISISQAGLLPTNCQPFSVYRFTDCLHASRHRRTRSSCLTSPERRDLFFSCLDPRRDSASDRRTTQLQTCRFDFCVLSFCCYRRPEFHILRVVIFQRPLKAKMILVSVVSRLA